MMQLSEAAHVLHAQQITGDGDVRFFAVSTDTRELQPGDLYVALRGEHFDGADFIAQAEGAGAVAALVNKDSFEKLTTPLSAAVTAAGTARPTPCEWNHESFTQQPGVQPLSCAGKTLHSGIGDLSPYIPWEDPCDLAVPLLNPAFPILLVEDTRLALGQLAAYWRHQFDIPLVAITGSNGKTTVKEMTAGILRAAAGSDEAVLATLGNLNNDIGMPLTLLQLNARHRYAVIEMGMNHAGEIDYLTRIACPQVALINNASGAHLEGMGSLEAVARAKGEILAGLQYGGSAIINADDAYAPLWRSLAGANSLLEFGLSSEADVSGIWRPLATGLQLAVQTPKGDFTVNMQVPGEHNARNALAATAVAIALNLPLESVAAGLEKFGGVVGRLQRKQARCGAVVIDDTYNANPASLHAAIAVLADASGHRVLVLGDMGELGENAADFHAEIGIAARAAGIEKLYTLGELSRIAAREFGDKAQHFENIEELQKSLKKELHAGTTVLVKGSRFMKMERVVKYLVSSESEASSGISTSRLPLTTYHLPRE